MKTARHPDTQGLANALEACAYWRAAATLTDDLVDLARGHLLDERALCGGDLAGLPEGAQARERAAQILRGLALLSVAGSQTLLQPPGHASSCQPAVFYGAARAVMTTAWPHATALVDHLEALRFRFVLSAKAAPDHAAFNLESWAALRSLADIAKSASVTLPTPSSPAELAEIEKSIGARAAELRGSVGAFDEVRRYNATLAHARASRSEDHFVARSVAQEFVARRLAAAPDDRRRIEQYTGELAKALQRAAAGAERAGAQRAAAIAEDVAELRGLVQRARMSPGLVSLRDEVADTAARLVHNLKMTGGDGGVTKLAPDMRSAEEAVRGYRAAPGRWDALDGAAWALACATRQHLVDATVTPPSADWRRSRFLARGAAAAVFSDEAGRRASPSLQGLTSAQAPDPAPAAAARRRMRA